MDMATKSKASKPAKSAGTPSTPSTSSAPSRAAQQPATIPKGVYLSALIYVEGDQAPASDFTALATSALKDALSSALKGDHGGLSMTLKSVDVQNDVEQDGGEQASKQPKFQF